MTTMQTEAPLRHQSLNASVRSAREQARMVVDGQMVLDAPYQRGDVWSVRQQRDLVRSWLLGLPIPAIVVNRRYEAFPDFKHSLAGGGEYAVIDGKQRLTTAVAWFFGGLTVPASWFEPDVVLETVETDDGPYVSQEGLEHSQQLFVVNRALLPVAEALLPTVQAEAQVYGLLNGGGVAQTEQDMARAAAIAES